MSVGAICAANGVAVVFLAVILVCYKLRKQKPETNLMFGMTCTTMLFLMCDVLYHHELNHMGNAAHAILFLSKTFYLVFNCGIIVMWGLFVEKNARTYDYKPSRWTFARRIAFCVNMVLLLANCVTPVLFRISPEGTFVVYPIGMWILTWINFASLTITAIIILRNRRSMRREFAIPVTVFPLFPLAAEVIKMINQSLDFLCFYAVAGLLLFFASQTMYSYVDELTGLENRVRMNQILDRWFSSRTEFTVSGVLIDIDGLQKTNQQYGHAAGDQKIRRVADMIKNLKDPGLLKVRYGGDEFLVLWRAENPGRISAIRTELEEAKKVLNASLPEEEEIRFGMGSYYCSNQNNMTREAFLKTIDRRLNQKRREIDSIIEKAIEDDSFEMHYQLVYNTEKGAFTSAEALCRLSAEGYGPISPEEFIPAAEKNGTIRELGIRILNKVCAFVSDLRFATLNLDSVAVNLSVSQCMDADLVPTIIGIVDSYGVPHGTIIFEITETALSTDREVFWSNVSALIDAGFTLSLDDFGSGYANAERFAKIPFGLIKIDRGLIDAYESERGRIVLKSMVRMMHEMSVPVVLEGVEKAEQVELGRELGCEFIQGFYYAEPLPASELFRNRFKTE